MNTGFNYTMKTFQVAAFFAALFLYGCAGVQHTQDTTKEPNLARTPTQDPTKEPNLARAPIGLHIQKIDTIGGMTYTDITVRNNSGKFIKSLYIEVLAYDGENRVGMTNNIFNSVNIGETMDIRKPVDSNGRPWNRWKYSYKIH